RLPLLLQRQKAEAAPRSQMTRCCHSTIDFAVVQHGSHANDVAMWAPAYGGTPVSPWSSSRLWAAPLQTAQSGFMLFAEFDYHHWLRLYGIQRKLVRWILGIRSSQLP